MNDPKQNKADNAENKAPQKPSGKKKAPKPQKTPRKSYGIFRKRRGGVLLTREEINEIKAGRKKLKKELRKIGEKSRKEFEITASSLGLYFDKNKTRAKILWFLSTKGIWVLLAAALLLMAAISGFALLAELKGHFTISMSDDMFHEGFSISEDPEFRGKTSHLFATPAANVPCISIVDIPENVDNINGEHNGNYFAYTFYLRNEGENEQTYRWEIKFNSESEVADATWVMLFEDGDMTIYAKPKPDGTPEVLPEWGNNTVGYLDAPLYDSNPDKSQYQVIDEVDGLTYWRIVPKPFQGEGILAAGEKKDTRPGEVHKYTIVVWLEGDDPDCTNDLIGKHIGFEMYMQMVEKEG